MSIPYLVKDSGSGMAVTILLIAFLASAALHIMVADMLILAGKNEQIPSLLNRYISSVGGSDLGRGRGYIKKALSIILFLMIVFFMVSVLSAYVQGGAQIIGSLFNLSELPSFIIIFVLCATPSFFGLRAIGLGEKYTVTLIIVVSLVLFIVSAFNIRNPLLISGGGILDGIRLYGMVMFCFGAVFSVPQVVAGLGLDKKRITLAIGGGLLINLGLMVIISMGVILFSKEITELAIIGWGSALGRPVELLASLFILCAMLTSFWSISLALSDTLKGRLKLGNGLSWLAATLPVLLIAALPTHGFSDLLQMASGIVAMITTIMLIPAYINALKSRREATILGNVGKNPVFIGVVAVLYLLMAVGAFV